MKKRIISLLMALVLAFSLLPRLHSQQIMPTRSA